MKTRDNIPELKKRIRDLEKENALLKKKKEPFYTEKKTVKTPKNIEPAFDKAALSVKKYFQSFKTNPSLSRIEISGQRYILMRAEALSSDFLKNIIKLYADRPTPEAIRIGSNLLFDMAHLIGIEDARNFHSKMKLKDPISKLSAGPIHFAYTGWAFVDILPESNPSPDEKFYIKYHHPYSFEADSWIRSGEKTDFAVCSMNAGYSSGWCEESFGIELTAVEISCRAKGDKNCTFIMAPPSRINDYLKKESQPDKRRTKYNVPLFFERKKNEEKIAAALKEKETLLREIHHRVKNNLQVITSLLKLHAEKANDKQFSEMVAESQNRIISMALIHEMLYANSDLSAINVSKYVRSLFGQLQTSYNKPGIRLQLQIPSSVSFEVDKMIPLGLILNEAMSNSFKYAFPEGQGEITVRSKDDSFSISDNGIGITGKPISKGNSSFGTELIYLLAEQIDASVHFHQDKGTQISIHFKEKN
jgi:two-component sensor histidine kinase/predicted hydrocarbon binding protein